MRAGRPPRRRPRRGRGPLRECRRIRRRAQSVRRCPAVGAAMQDGDGATAKAGPTMVREGARGMGARPPARPRGARGGHAASRPLIARVRLSGARRRRPRRGQGRQRRRRAHRADSSTSRPPLTADLAPLVHARRVRPPRRAPALARRRRRPRRAHAGAGRAPAHAPRRARDQRRPRQRALGPHHARGGRADQRSRAHVRGQRGGA